MYCSIIGYMSNDNSNSNNKINNDLIWNGEIWQTRNELNNKLNSKNKRRKNKSNFKEWTVLKQVNNPNGSNKGICK